MIREQVFCFQCLTGSRYLPTDDRPVSCPYCHSTDVEVITERLGTYIHSLQISVDRLTDELSEKRYGKQRNNRKRAYYVGSH